MDGDNSVSIAAASFVVLSGGYMILKKKKHRIRRNRRFWTAKLHRRRKEYTGNLSTDLPREPFENESFTQMSSEDFNDILTKLAPIISKQDTQMRNSIPPKDRLAITLRFLATGDSYRSLQYLFKVSPQIISRIVPEVCRAIVQVLCDDYIKLPATANEWKTVSKTFEHACQIPHCLGVLDAKHVIIQPPVNSGTQISSIVLMTIVDADYQFRFVDVDCQHQTSNTKMYRKIANDDLNCPPNEPLPGRSKPVPYVFVGDNSFGLTKNILTPFHPLNTKFNHKISRARRIVDNAFGLMASVFRVLRKPTLLQRDTAALVVMACVILHNFLSKSQSSRSLYSPEGSYDYEENGDVIQGSWREGNEEMTSLLPLDRLSTQPDSEALEIRQEFATYFCSPVLDRI